MLLFDRRVSRRFLNTLTKETRPHIVTLLADRDLTVECPCMQREKRSCMSLFGIVLCAAYVSSRPRFLCTAYVSCMSLFGIVLCAAYVSSRPQ